MFSPNEIDEVLQVMDYHYSFMIFASLGEEVLSEQDRWMLESYGVNIELVKLKFPPYMQMFMLGRLAAVLRSSEMKSITAKDFATYLQKGQFIPLSDFEQVRYNISREMTYSHLKGQANKVVGATRDIILEQNKMHLVQQTIAEGVANRKSVSQIISELGHRSEEWDRDWKRIVVTEMQNIYNFGKASMIAEKFGPNSRVYKDVFPGACRHCLRLYLTGGIGSAPRLFMLSDLINNGNNIGRHTSEWLPIVGATHPHCRCDLRNIHNNQIWDKENKRWVYNPNRERKLVSHTKIKITVGDKIFLV